MVFPLRGVDGRFRSFLTRTVPQRSPEGRLLQWFGTSTDITERILMEEGLRKAREELEVRVQQLLQELRRHHRRVVVRLADRRLQRIHDRVVIGLVEVHERHEILIRCLGLRR